MNKYRVTRANLREGGERREEALLIDADSFEFLSSEYTVIAVFKNLFGEVTHAVDGFDHIQLVEPEEEKEPEDEPGVLERVDVFLADTDLGTPRVRSPEPDTMVA